MTNNTHCFKVEILTKLDLSLVLEFTLLLTILLPYYRAVIPKVGVGTPPGVVRYCPGGPNVVSRNGKENIPSVFNNIINSQQHILSKLSKICIIKAILNVLLLDVTISNSLF